jgi:hypothetical protein
MKESLPKEFVILNLSHSLKEYLLMHISFESLATVDDY